MTDVSTTESLANPATRNDFVRSQVVQSTQALLAVHGLALTMDQIADGSGLSRRPLHDARGIFCTNVCDECEAEKRLEFRAEIFTNGAYQADDLGDDDPEGAWL